VKISTHLDYQTILANQAVPVYFALQLQCPEITEARSQPAAFCVVLDRSGSMRGAPLERAKEATQVAIRNLRSEDLFSLVIFGDQAQTVIPLQKVQNKESVQQAVARIQSGGSTNLTGGWMLGRDELAKAPAGTSRRVLLLSDGHLNVGIVDPPQVRSIVANGLGEASVRTSCLGFGDNYNEDLLSNLAAATGGVFYDAVSPERFPAIFDSELQGLQNVRLRLKPLDFCDGYTALGEYPSVQLPDGRREFALGDLVSNEERIAVFALSTLPLPAVNGQPVVSLEGEQLIEVELAYDEFTKEGISSKTYRQIIRIQSTQDPAQVIVSAQTIPWVALQRAGKAIKSAVECLDTGNRDAAVALLRECQEALRRYGPIQEVEESLRNLERLISDILSGFWDVRARKASSYRSLSLLKMSSRDLWSGEGPAPSFKQPRSRPPTPPTPPTPPSTPPPADPPAPPSDPSPT
jgi:Ca-activated chloride channel homolog